MRDDHIEILLLIDFPYQTSTEGVANSTDNLQQLLHEGRWSL